MKRPRKNPSTLSLNQRLHKLEAENAEFREALETIADVLEEVGIIEGDDSKEELIPSEGVIIDAPNPDPESEDLKLDELV